MKGGIVVLMLSSYAVVQLDRQIFIGLNCFKAKKPKRIEQQVITESNAYAL